MSEITIYHNPKCGTSRNTLALIRHSGAEPHVIEYLKTPPRETLIYCSSEPSILVCAERQSGEVQPEV